MEKVLTELTTKGADTDVFVFVWFIFVGVKLSRKEGKSLTPLQTHMLIMQWLSTAQKRKIFPKSMAPDIIWLQEQGKLKGPAARLYSKVEYIWLASSGELAGQSTLFRFTCMIDTLRSMGWKDYLLSDADWENNWIAGSEVSAIYTQKSRLHSSVSESGQLIVPLEVRITGNPDGIFPLLNQCNLKIAIQPFEFEYTVLFIQPDAEI